MNPSPEQIAEATRVLWDAMDRREVLYLYAIQEGDDGPVKIGIAKSPTKRLLTLQQANPRELKLIAAWRGLIEEERGWHEHFDRWRIRGEWFEPAPELLEMVDRLHARWEPGEWP